MMISSLFALAVGLAPLSDVPPTPDRGPQPQPGSADIYRDQFGIPHIYAGSEADGFYALGYAQAEDSARALLAIALAVEGRAASALGEQALPWGGSAISSDAEALRWRIAEQAKAGFAALPAHLREQLESYARGFRAYVEQNSSTLPDWDIRFEAWHALAWPQLALWSFNVGDGVGECAAGGAKLAASTIDHQRERKASNVWAVAPRRTENGATILLSDPHGPIPGEGNPFFEFRMMAGGLDVAGYAMGALPALAHTEKVAWGLTTGGPDVSDCYRLRVDGDRYSLAGKWYQFDTLRHSLQVAGGSPKELQFRYASINGKPAPVLSEADGYAYAVSTPYWGSFADLFIQFDQMIRAANAEEVLEAAKVQGMFPQNLLIADAEGTIIYLRAGRTPQRDSALDWSRPVSGDDARAPWKGIHPAGDLVMLRNPPTGYLQNNNTTPSNMTAGRPLLNADDYPAYIWNDRFEQQFWDRAARANEVLSTSSTFSIDDAIDLALDEKWYATERWTAALKEAVARRGVAFDDGSEEARVLQRLLSFDGHASKESVAALNSYFWRTAVVTLAGSELLQTLQEEIAGGAPASKKVLELLLQAIPHSVVLMRERVGSVDRPYGDWFRLGRSPKQHYPIGGGPSMEWSDFNQCLLLQRPAFTCAFTQRAFASVGRTDDGRPLITHGSRALRLVVLGSEFRSYSLHNFGQSDDPNSSHWDDQAQQLSSGSKLRLLPFSFEELTGQVTAHRTLVVGND